MKPTSTFNQQETYGRSRDNPYFHGMRRGQAVVMNHGNDLDFPGKSMKTNMYSSASDIGSRGSRNISVKVSEDVPYSSKDSPSDIILEPIGRTSSGRWSKTSSPLIVPQLDFGINFQDTNGPTIVLSPDAKELELDFTVSIVGPVMQRSYSVSNGQTDISNIPLPPSAALFYCGSSPQMEVVESCASVDKLNIYLKAMRDYVNTGVPGKFLHAVIGPNDVGSVVSTIMYAFYLDQTLKSNQLCSVPVINIRRSELGSHPDLWWLLLSCHIDLSSLIFIDEIDLSYYELFGSLKLVLINCDKIPSELEAMREAIVEVFHCTKSDTSYSWVGSSTVREDVSCCTILAERFAMTSPEILAGNGFSRLLLAGILVDTGNLSIPHCTSKDKYIATLLINGGGRFGHDGLYQILKYKIYGSNDLKVQQILHKEFKKWTRSGKPSSNSLRMVAPNIGMSSIGLSVIQLLSHDSSSIQEIAQFQKSEKLGLLMVVSGYYDPQKIFKRELLVCAESAEHLKNVLMFLNSNAAHLPLKLVHQSGLSDEMRLFETEKVTHRRTIEQLLEEFMSTSI